VKPTLLKTTPHRIENLDAQGLSYDSIWRLPSKAQLNSIKKQIEPHQYLTNGIYLMKFSYLIESLGIAIYKYTTKIHQPENIDSDSQKLGIPIVWLLDNWDKFYKFTLEPE